MGFSETSVDSDSAKKWVIAGIPLRAPLKTIFTAQKSGVDQHHHAQSTEREDGETTPRGEGYRIPAVLTCPPAPRKRKAPARKCNYDVVKEYFNPPDLETVFTSIRHVAKG